MFKTKKQLENFVKSKNVEKNLILNEIDDLHFEASEIVKSRSLFSNEITSYNDKFNELNNKVDNIDKEIWSAENAFAKRHWTHSDHVFTELVQNNID